jgi:putative Mg2+ transporter-C (MgtC) family protein
MAVPWFLLGRIAAGTVLGGIIGYERDRHGRPAGLRTHMVVALASATFMVVSTHFIEHQRYEDGVRVQVDVSRIASSIVTGIGFLGGGAILRTGLSIQGLTTAAGLWLVGAIGMAAGSGMYVVAVFATLFGLLTMGLLRRFEQKAVDVVPQRLRMVLPSSGSTREAEERLGRLNVSVVTTGIRHDAARDALEVEFDLRLPTKLTPEAVAEALRDLPDVREFSLESEKKA